MKRAFKVLAILLLAGLAVWGALVVTVRPSNDRAWKPEHARLPFARFEGDSVRIENVRDFRWSSADSFEARYDDRSYDLDGLESLWLVLAVFHPEGDRGPAHTMLSFGFADGSYLVISVEARKEVGESYSVWRGLVRQYELMYVIGDERDLVLTRAVYRPDEVFLYPIRTTPEKIRALLVDMLKSADALPGHPEFYNTLTNNCTTRLWRHVEDVAPGRIPPSWKILLPGYSDELIRSLGLLNTDLGIDAARRRFRINDRARRYAGSPDFSRRIREPATKAGARGPPG